MVKLFECKAQSIALFKVTKNATLYNVQHSIMLGEAFCTICVTSTYILEVEFPRVLLTYCRQPWLGDPISKKEPLFCLVLKSNLQDITRETLFFQIELYRSSCNVFQQQQKNPYSLWSFTIPFEGMAYGILYSIWIIDTHCIYFEMGNVFVFSQTLAIPSKIWDEYLIICIHRPKPPMRAPGIIGDFSFSYDVSKWFYSSISQT